MWISHLSTVGLRFIRHSCIFNTNLIKKNQISQIYSNNLNKNELFLSTFSNVSICANVQKKCDDSYYKSPSLTSKNELCYQTRDLISSLKYKEFDRFQSDIFKWIKTRCKNKEYHYTYESDNYKKVTDDPEKQKESNVTIVIGGINTGKTTSYLLALSDVVNDPYKEAFRGNRDNYRSKIMLYGNLKGSKLVVSRKLKKINGIPKFNWNSYVVPVAIVLVPFRELGLNIFELCTKLNLRSRLIAGGKGYKKQTGITGGNIIEVNKNYKDNVDIVIATPEMLYRSLHGELEDIKIEIRFVKFIIFEESDILSELSYLEKINEIINLTYTENLNLIYLSRFKTETLVNNIEQFMITKGKEEHKNMKIGKDVEIIEKEANLNDKEIKKIFIHTSNNDRLEVLIDVINEINHNQYSEVNRSKNVKSENKTVIYCSNTKCNKFLKYSLLDRGFKITNLFGEMNYEERTENLKKFQLNSNILITNSFATRFKIGPKVNNVILFNCPNTLNEYIHHMSTFMSHPNNIKNSRIYIFFNNKNVKLIKDIQGMSKSFKEFEFRNLPVKVSKKLYLNQKMIIKELNRNEIKVGKKKIKLTSRKNKLSPKNKKIMKKFYLKDKAIKKVEFLRKRGILKKGYGIPKMPDKKLEMSDSQEYIKMKRSPDGFLQIIPKRRSRIKKEENVQGYDEESVIIPGVPTYASETLEEKKHHRNTHF